MDGMRNTIMTDHLTQARETATGAFFLAMALAMPMLFHLAGLGKVFLPMLLPILLAGFVLSWRLAALTGFLAPILSSLLTGMPPLAPPIAPMMMLELAVLGMVPALMYRKWRLGLWPALICGILACRIVNFVLHVILAEFFNIPGITWGLVTLIFGTPGIILQIVTVPIVIPLLERRFPSLKPANPVKPLPDTPTGKVDSE